MTSRSSRRTLFVVAVVAAIAAVAAGVAVAAAPGKKVEQAAWRACMERHGVAFQGELPARESLQKALAACGLPWQKTVQTFVACVRAHGGGVALTTAVLGLGTDRLERAARQCGLDTDSVRSTVRERTDRLASCMRDHGVAVPTQTTGLRQALGALLQVDGQTLVDAWQSCRGELRLELPGLVPGG